MKTMRQLLLEQTDAQALDVDAKTFLLGLFPEKTCHSIGGWRNHWVDGKPQDGYEVLSYDNYWGFGKTEAEAWENAALRHIFGSTYQPPKHLNP